MTFDRSGKFYIILRKVRGSLLSKVCPMKLPSSLRRILSRIFGSTVQESVHKSTPESVGHIRKNGMRYAGRMSDGTKVIHTQFDIRDILDKDNGSTFMTFNQAAKKVNTEEICGYPARALNIPSQDQLNVIRLSYDQETRNQIGPVWALGRPAGVQFFHDGDKMQSGRDYLAQTCFVPRQPSLALS